MFMYKINTHNINGVRLKGCNDQLCMYVMYFVEDVFCGQSMSEHSNHC